MFGEFMLVSGLTALSACTSKILEMKGKKYAARGLDITTKTALFIFAAKKINELIKEFTSL